MHIVCQVWVCAWLCGIWVNTFRKTDVRVDKEGDDVACDNVLCRWRSPEYSPAVRSLFHAAQTQAALHRGRAPVSQIQSLEWRLPLPPSQWWATHKCTGHACKPHTYAQRHIRECFYTHTHAEGWPLSPSHTQLSSVPSICLFLATPVLIASHSISITSANCAHSSARTVFLRPLLMHLFSPFSHPSGIVS